MTHFSHYPPYLYLFQLSEHCSQAINLYLILWRDKNKSHKVFYDKKHVVDELLIPWKKFKTDLRLLVKEGLAEFALSEDDKEVVVTLADLEADFMESSNGRS